MGLPKEQNANKKDQIKVLMLIGNLDAGGKERQLIALLKGLKERKHFSTIVAVMNPNGLRESEASQFASSLVNVSRLFGLDLLSPVIKLIRLVRWENIQVIHTWGSGIWDLVGLLAAKFCRVPMLHGGIRLSPSRLDFSNRLTKWSAQKADTIVANSQAGLKAFGFAADPRSRVIYNGVDMSRFEGLPESPPENHENLCMVANFSNKKDHISLVAAMPAILTSFPDARLLLVGHDAGTLDAVKAYASEIGVESHVEFITDTLRPEPFIAKSRIGILSTNEMVHGEGTANALLEYMALSKPVVVSDNGGNREVVKDGQSGFVIKPGSPEEIAKHVNLLLADATRAKEMGRMGKAILIEKFDMEKMVNAYVEIYQALKNQDSG